MALFARFLVRVYKVAVCNPDACGETIDEYCGGPSGAPRGRTDLRENEFAAPKQAPPHVATRGGAVAPTSHSRTPLVDDERKVVLNASAY